MKTNDASPGRARAWRFVRAGLVTALLVAGCGGSRDEPRQRPSGTKVLLLGLDGASWNLIEPMLERGVLPNLERLVHEGVSAPMHSDEPCLSIVLWTSVATGRLPAAHGIRDWSYRDPETGEKGLMTSERRRVHALWDLLTLARRTSGFVNWWATWPAEPVDGFLVSEQFTRKRPGEMLERATYPPALADELREPLAETEWPWLRAQLDAGTLKVLADRQESAMPLGAEERYRQAWFLYGQDYLGERALDYLLEKEPHPELLGVLSRKIDVASHYMWQFGSEPRPSFEELSRLLEPVYRYEDALLGRLMSQLEEDVNVLVVSDHGFTWESEGLGHEETAPPGIFVAWGPAFVEGRRLPEVRLYDVAPTVLHVLGLPLARDLDGQLLDDALARERPPRFVDTYGTRETGRAKSPLEDRILEELRSLGYVP